jgi:hypothetical protein
LVAVELDSRWEESAQSYAALVIRAKARLDEGSTPEEADYQSVDVNCLDMVRPRSVGVERVCLQALRQVGLGQETGATRIQWCANCGGHRHGHRAHDPTGQ